MSVCVCVCFITIMDATLYPKCGVALSAFSNTRERQRVFGFVVEVLHPASEEQATPRAL